MFINWTILENSLSCSCPNPKMNMSNSESTLLLHCPVDRYICSVTVYLERITKYYGLALWQQNVAKCVWWHCGCSQVTVWELLHEFSGILYCGVLQKCPFRIGLKSDKNNGLNTWGSIARSSCILRAVYWSEKCFYANFKRKSRRIRSDIICPVESCGLSHN